MPKMEVIGPRVETGELGHANKQTDATKRIISPAWRSIKVVIVGIRAEPSKLRIQFQVKMSSKNTFCSEK